MRNIFFSLLLLGGNCFANTYWTPCKPDDVKLIQDALAGSPDAKPSVLVDLKTLMIGGKYDCQQEVSIMPSSAPAGTAYKRYEVRGNWHYRISLTVSVPQSKVLQSEINR